MTALMVFTDMILTPYINLCSRTSQLSAVDVALSRLKRRKILAVVDARGISAAIASNPTARLLSVPPAVPDAEDDDPILMRYTTCFLVLLYPQDSNRIAL